MFGVCHRPTELMTGNGGNSNNSSMFSSAHHHSHHHSLHQQERQQQHHMGYTHHSMKVMIPYFITNFSILNTAYPTVLNMESTVTAVQHSVQLYTNLSKLTSKRQHLTHFSGVDIVRRQVSADFRICRVLIFLVVFARPLHFWRKSC